MTSIPTASLNREEILRNIGTAYFNGLGNGDVSIVPYAQDATLRTPLAPGGEEVPIVGRDAILDFFSGIYEAIGSVLVKDFYFNRTLTSICIEAEVGLRGTGKKLFVADVFNVSVDGRVTTQHNHYDPRAAIGG